MGPQPKFNFVPEKQLLRSTDPTYRVTIYSKNKIDKKTGEKSLVNNLVFTKEVVNVYELGGKFIRFYADKEKRTIGWSILGEHEAGPLEEIEGTKKVKVNSAGIALFGIGRLLKSVNITLTDNRKGLIVSTYRSSLHSHPIYYIKL